MLRVSIEEETEQVDLMLNQLKANPCYQICDQTELIQPNSTEKNLVCYLYPKTVKRSISRVFLTTTNGESISFELLNCHTLELEAGKQLVFGWNYDIYS